MQLPNAEQAVVDISKLKNYCLNIAHARGKHKARVFASVLGIGAEQAELLREALIEATRTSPATPVRKDAYGARYVVDFPWHTRTGTATVRSVWIVRTGEDFPRLTTCFVL